MKPPRVDYRFPNYPADVLANLVLVAVPLYVLWGSRLPTIPRRIIRIVFAITLLTSAVSVVHLCTQFRGDPRLEGFTALYEVSADPALPGTFDSC
jgi:hypothetical protein